MHGFKNVLTDWLKHMRPERIVEWGPGLSTELMLEHAPGAQIVSIEHDAGWLEKAREAHGSKVQLVHQSCTNRNSAYASCIYDHQPFDLAFVDGRRRVECVLTALTWLRPGGVVILHDVCRINYTKPLGHYVQMIELRSNTAVMVARHLPPPLRS